MAGKLITRCAEPYAEGDLVTVQLDMEQHSIAFLKNGVLQGTGEGLPGQFSRQCYGVGPACISANGPSSSFSLLSLLNPPSPSSSCCCSDEVWAYVSLDNVMDSITLHSSSMFTDLAQSLRWNPAKSCRMALLTQDGQCATLRSGAAAADPKGEEVTGQATVVGLREYNRTEVHTWIVRFEQSATMPPANFLVGLAPPGIDANKSLGEEGCGIGLDYYGYFYVNGRYFHASNLATWSSVAKPVRGSTAKHKGERDGGDRRTAAPASQG